MSNNVQHEIALLRNKIEQLEKQELLDELKYKETNITYNMRQLDNFIQMTKNKISENKYSKSNLAGKWDDMKIISYLPLIYNLLKITNERLDKIESFLKQQDKI